MAQYFIESTDPTATFPDIKSPFVGLEHPPGRRELLTRIEDLEMRVNSQEGRLSRLVIREAKARHARMREEAQTDGEVSVRVVKTVSFHLCFTVAEMAEYFEVNPSAIRANQGNYARKMADITVIDYCRSPWPRNITKIDILSTDVVKVER